MIMEEILKELANELRAQNYLLALLWQEKIGYRGNAGDSAEYRMNKYLSKNTELLDAIYHSVATSPTDS